ncbi:hypothetical protein [Streptomyces sp. NPDC001889]
MVNGAPGTAGRPAAPLSVRPAVRFSVRGGASGVLGAVRGSRLAGKAVPDLSRRTSHGPPGRPRARFRFRFRSVTGTGPSDPPPRAGPPRLPAHPSGDLAETDPYGTCTALVRALAPFRIAYLHHGETGTELDTAVRELWPTALMVTPLPAGRDKPGAAARSLERGADLVSFGRDFLANPDLVTRCRAGAPLNEARPTGFHGGGAEGYTDYPALGDRPVPGP